MAAKDGPVLPIQKGALHGRSLGSQLGVIEWLVCVIFSDHLDSDLTIGTLSNLILESTYL